MHVWPVESVTFQSPAEAVEPLAGGSAPYDRCQLQAEGKMLEKDDELKR
jgi:hypothetical protein